MCVVDDDDDESEDFHGSYLQLRSRHGRVGSLMLDWRSDIPSTATIGSPIYSRDLKMPKISALPRPCIFWWEIPCCESIVIPNTSDADRSRTFSRY